MNLSPICKKVYLKWIDNPNWHKAHDTDMRRFYQFVSAYRQYSRKKISTYDLEMDIIRRHEGKLDQEFLTCQARKYSEAFSVIIDFLAVTKR